MTNLKEIDIIIVIIYRGDEVMFYEVQEVITENEKRNVQKFLDQFQLKYEQVDSTIIIQDNGKIIATCSKQDNVLKCFAIEESYQGLGLTNTLVSHMTQKLHQKGIYHHFIFTKPESSEMFENLGYKKIVCTDKVSLLETGNQSITKWIEKLKQRYNINPNEEHAAIVMNCNPFTLGHKYLIETVSKENKNVIVFIVEEDKSIFKFNDRIELVRKGVVEFTNVVVVPASRYIISMATFPTYFLKQSDDILRTYTELDCSIFGKYFAKPLNITRRYVGNEPNCEVTEMYNTSMKNILPHYGVEIKVIQRIERNTRPISATLVRELLKNEDRETLATLVPLTTYQFLIEEFMNNREISVIA